jgi:hypothetical protein
VNALKSNQLHAGQQLIIYEKTTRTRHARRHHHNVRRVSSN